MLFSTVTVFALSALAATARSIPRRVEVESRDDSHSLQKRAFNGRATFYDVGLGACGDVNVASDFIVALNSAQMGGGYPAGPCGKAITISYNGKTAGAVVKDACPTCGYGDLDFSRGLFDYFASEDVGTFQMSWWFNDDAAPVATKAKAATSTYVAPTSTWVAPTTSTSTWVAPTTTSTSQSPAWTEQSSAAAASALAASSSLSVSSSLSASAAASSASASSSKTAQDSTASALTDGTEPVVIQTGSNIRMFNEAVAFLGHMVVAGAGGVVA